jgi:hypothetical protein
MNKFCLCAVALVAGWAGSACGMSVVNGEITVEFGYVKQTPMDNVKVRLNKPIQAVLADVRAKKYNKISLLNLSPGDRESLRILLKDEQAALRNYRDTLALVTTATQPWLYGVTALGSVSAGWGGYRVGSLSSGFLLVLVDRVSAVYNAITGKRSAATEGSRNSLLRVLPVVCMAVGGVAGAIYAHRVGNRFAQSWVGALLGLGSEDQAYASQAPALQMTIDQIFADLDALEKSRK